MRTAAAQGYRASERTAHRVAEKLARNAGVGLDEWIDEAVLEYAEDLGVDPRDLDARERLQALEERIDRAARAAPADARRRPTDDGRRGARGETRDRDYDEEPRAPSDLRRYESRRAPGADSRDRLEQAVADIERRAARNERRTAQALESLSEFVEARGAERGRLDEAVAEIEARAARNEERTARALQSLAGLVEARGGERERLQQAISDVEARAERTAERTARALESLAGAVDARRGERDRLEAAVERIGKRAEDNEARTARALESLAALATPAPAAPAAPARPAAPSPAEDAVASRLDALARRAGRAPEAPATDDETFRLVAERLARRRKPRPEVDVAPAAETSPRPSNDRDPALEAVERRLAGLAEQMERLAARSSAPPAPALDGVERRLEELGARVEAAARRPAPENRPLEDLGRRVEAIRAAMERQGARPDGPALAAALARLDEKLDRAAASDAQSSTTTAALHGVVARLEEALQRPANITLDARPIEELARRIEGVRGLVERQGALAPKVEEINSAVGELKRKLDRPATPAAPPAEALRIESALRQLSDEVHALARAGAADQSPVEELAQRLESLRQAVEAQGAASPQIDRLERMLGDIRARLDRPAKHPEFEAVDATLRQLVAKVEQALSRPSTHPEMQAIDATLRQLAAKVEQASRPSTHPEMQAVEATLRQLAVKVEQAMARPATVSLDPRPIEDLARRIESVRESLENPALAPQVERLESALGAMAEKLDRAQPALDAQGINSTLAAMNARLEEAFRRPAAAESEPIEALAARVEAVRETVERQTEQLDVVGRPLDDLGRRLDGLRETVERQAGQFDFGRLEDVLRDAVGQLGRPAAGPEEMRAVVAAIQALAAKIEGAGDLHADLFARVAERLERPGVEPADLATLADAVADLAARADRPALDLSRLEAIVQRAVPAAAPEFDHLAVAVAELGEKLDRAQGGLDPLAERLVNEVAFRLDGIEARLEARADGAAPLQDNLSHLELGFRELAEKFADLRAVADTRAVEQEVRLLHDRLDDLADRRAPEGLAEEAAQAIAREVGQRLGAADPIVGQIHGLHERLDQLVSTRPTPAALESAMVELTEELGAFRSAREAVGRGAVTLSEMRAEQIQLDRRMDARFASLQDVLEKLVDRAGRDPGDAAPRAAAPAPRAAMLDIPDRAPGETRLAPAVPEIGPAAAPSARGRAAESPDAKAAAINAHIAAARRAANAAAADTERREEIAKARKAANGAGFAQRATALLNQHRRPVLLGAAGAMTVLTGLAMLEMRGHAPMRKSEIDAPASPLAQADPAATSADMTPTGALSAAAPQVIAAPLPPSKTLGPKPDAALASALPAALGGELASAAGRGDVGAEIEIAQRYFEGRGVPRDSKIAAQWMQAAADGGDVYALYRVGALYEKGVGVARDAAKARDLYTRAANAGNARAMHNLAVLYAQDGGAGKPDYAGALDWFRKAASYGVRDSQFNLGVLYGRGLGAPQDLAQSWMWFSAAAKQGDADAAHKRDEVANRMDGRAMTAAKAALEAFKAKTPDPAVNDPPPAPAAAADAKTAPAAAADAKTAPAAKS